ncbi:MAG TPA: hypothetical protein VK625_06620 [Flavitalea sp.]|nr:hypothetical protein [Flavitalea sp.]
MQNTMFSIRKVAINGLAAIFLTFLSAEAIAQNSKPIVDIRFDADYLQVPTSIGDEWAPTWGADGALYTGNDDGASFGGIGNRNIAFGKLVGDNPYHLKGTTINEMKDYGFAGEKGPDSASWKTMNSYSVDGILYMFVTRCLYPEQSGDAKKRHIFRSSSIIKSADKGLTWTRSESENYNNPMFPGLRFGAPYFVWYGKDGEASVDNADKYVYAVSNNGHFEDGDNYIIGRVLRSKLANLNAKDWQFFSGDDGMQDKNWNGDMNKSKPVLQDSMNCSMTGMTYIKGLGRYVMVVWHYTTYDLRKDPRTINQYYEAPKPWGPWTKFKTVDTENLGWYVPIIGQKFQTVVNANTVQCYLYPTGYYINPCLYKLSYIPITLSTVPLSK